MDKITYYPYYNEEHHNGDIVIIKLSRCVLILVIPFNYLSDNTFLDIYQKKYPGSIIMYISWRSEYDAIIANPYSPHIHIQNIKYAPKATCNLRTNLT